MTLDDILNIVRPLCDKTKDLLRPFPQVMEGDDLELYLYRDKQHGHEYFYPRSQRYVNWGVCPTCTVMNNGEQRLDATDIVALCIAARWSNGRIRFNSDECRLKFNYLIARFAQQCQSAGMQGDYKLLGIVPSDAPKGYSEAPLMVHQSVASRCAQGSPAYGLLMEQGTGKTATAISIVDEEVDKLPDDQVYHHLIVCPKNVCTNWIVEYQKFSKHDNTVHVIRGSKIKRLKQMLEARMVNDVRISVCIISYESFVLSKEQIRRMHWDKVTMDESHFFKSHYTKRWKVIEELRDEFNSRLILTGTPITNTMMDLWTQLEFLGRGWSGFNTFKGFKKFYGVFANNDGDHDMLVGLQNIPFIQERLARCAFIVKKSEVLKDLPEKNYHIIDVEMSKEQREIYTRVSQEIMIQIERELENPRAMTINNVLTMLLRLAQITSGFVTYDQEFDPETLEPVGERIVDRLDPNPKLEQLVDLIKSFDSTSKIIIWSKWRMSVAMIKARLTLEGIPNVTFTGSTKDKDRAEAVRSFNEDPDMRCFIGNPSAGGVGINLLGNASEEHACDKVIYFDQDWSAAVRSQSEDRPHRRGTKRPVDYYDLCCDDSIDYQIISRVTSKRKHALEIQDIRSILGAML